MGSAPPGGGCRATRWMGEWRISSLMLHRAVTASGGRRPPRPAPLLGPWNCPAGFSAFAQGRLCSRIPSCPFILKATCRDFQIPVSRPLAWILPAAPCAGAGSPVLAHFGRPIGPPCRRSRSPDFDLCANSFRKDLRDQEDPAKDLSAPPEAWRTSAQLRPPPAQLPPHRGPARLPSEGSSGPLSAPPRSPAHASEPPLNPPPAQGHGLGAASLCARRGPM